ncbi:hypothetical protein EDB83DRAFT_2516982 [Lactarius deliciosus]|nr:hypothetical protein EDB83DRAFT_2516982 [Lactarius deliciosus]
MLATAFMRTLAGPIPTTFTGDRAQAQQFLEEFRQLEWANLRHPLITCPVLRVELALTLIRGPTTNPWRHTVRRGQPGEGVDEDIWDECMDSFFTVWIDEPPVPMTQASSPVTPVPAASPDLASSTITSAAQRTEEHCVIPAPAWTLLSPRLSPNPPDNPIRTVLHTDPDPRPPAQAVLDPEGRCTVVEDDNSPERGVKTLTSSVFALDFTVLPPPTSKTNTPNPPTPRLKLPICILTTNIFPRHALEMPRDPNGLATHPTNS